jgi:hypothetical protein
MEKVPLKPGTPYLDISRADPQEAQRIAEYIYEVFKSQGYWDGQYVSYDLNRLINIVAGVRTYIPKLIRGDTEMPPDRRSTVRQHFIMMDRGADSLTLRGTPMYLEMMDVVSMNVDEFLKYIRYRNERP